MKKQTLQNGQSLIEIILAVALFAIFSTGAVLVVLQGLDLNRLGLEHTVATQYATEGIEAVRSIKNQNFSNLINSSGTGIIRSGGLWVFSGSNNQFGPSNKYTRTIAVSDVYVDGVGNIVTSGGTLDPNSKKITCTVTWNFSPTRNDSVSMSTYLMNWKGIDTSNTCNGYAVGHGYASGTCRQNASQCTGHGEIHLTAGDAYCPTNPPQDTCCALAGPTPTPTTGATPTPTSTPTPTPTPTSAPTCQAYCAGLGGYSTGICRQNPGKCTNNGEINETGGNAYCPHSGNLNVCCCH